MRHRDAGRVRIRGPEERMSTRPAKIAALALLALLALAGCQSMHTSQPLELSYPRLEPADLGAMHNVSVSDGVWMGGAPVRSDLDLAQRRGIRLLIDLCAPGEAPDYDLAGACHELDLEYLAAGVES